MGYKSIRQMLHMSHATTRPELAAEELYQQRITSYSAYRSGIQLGNHEIFAVAFREMTSLLDTIRESETKVAQLWNGLPRSAKRALLLELIGQEVQHTTAIEGVHTTRKEIAQALEAAQHMMQSSWQPQTSHRLAEFAHLYLNLSQNQETQNQENQQQENGTHQATTFASSLEDIRTIYDSVVQGEIDAQNYPDGQLFRKQPVSIWDETRGKRVHEGAANETEIQVKLTQWLALSRNGDIPLPLRAALCHFAFEVIHPFYDGNGRTGRFLLAQQLSTSFSLPTALSMSSTIAKHKSQYYRAFDDAEFPLNCADASLFCFTMLTFLHQAQLSVTENLEEKSQDWQAAQIRLLTYCAAQLHSDDGLDGDSGDRLASHSFDELPTVQLLASMTQMKRAQFLVLSILAQEHIFSTIPRLFTRRQLQEELHMGNSQLLHALSALQEQQMITTVGLKPIRYQLSSRAIEELGL